MARARKILKRYVRIVGRSGWRSWDTSRNFNSRNKQELADHAPHDQAQNIRAGALQTGPSSTVPQCPLALWIAISLVIFVLPDTYPIDLRTVNYSPIAVGLALIVLLATWFFPKHGARHWYRGKAHTLDDQKRGGGRYVDGFVDYGLRAKYGPERPPRINLLQLATHITKQVQHMPARVELAFSSDAAAVDKGRSFPPGAADTSKHKLLAKRPTSRRAGASDRGGQSSLARMSDAGEERESEIDVDTEEATSAGKGLSTEERLSPNRREVQLQDQDGQTISAEENKSKEQKRPLPS